MKSFQTLTSQMHNLMFGRQRRVNVMKLLEAILQSEWPRLITIAYYRWRF